MTNNYTLVVNGQTAYSGTDVAGFVAALLAMTPGSTFTVTISPVTAVTTWSGTVS